MWWFEKRVFDCVLVALCSVAEDIIAVKRSTWRAEQLLQYNGK
jgi:hypothetical protein